VGPLPTAVPGAALTEFQQFLAGGPAHWATTHLMEVPADARLTWHHGKQLGLRNNLTVDYVMWERDRHPGDFDRHHPILGPMLAAKQDAEGTPFTWFASKHARANHPDAIHADSGSASRSDSVPGAQAQTLQPTAISPVLTMPRVTANLQPQVALETLQSPSTPSVSDLPPPGRYQPPLSREISSTSVVGRNVPAEELLHVSPEAVPEPSSWLMMLLLFGAGAGWQAGRGSGGRSAEVC
jgi:hypothetical protein